MYFYNRLPLRCYAVSALALALTFVCSQRALAHGDFLYMPQSSLDAALYLSAQNKGPSDETLWQIPGVLMGGEATGSERGVAINDASLRYTWANIDGVFAVGEVGAHGHGSDLELMLEQAFSGYHWTHTSGHIKLEAGKMKGAFSLANPLHPAGRDFTEASLPYQAFLGDHFSDLGARAQFMNWHGENGLSTYGTELWRGHEFPANKSADSPAWDVFARYQHTAGRLQMTTGAWYMRTEAKDRRDDRTEDGHFHGGLNTGSDIRFTGDTDITGFEAGALWQHTPVLAYTLNGEFIVNRSDGMLRDDTRQAVAKLKQQGASIALATHYLQHHLALRYELIKSDNTLSGAGSSSLGPSAGLDANHHRPERISLAYQYSWQSGVSFRGEAIHDASSRDSLDYFRISVFWNGNLFSK